MSWVSWLGTPPSPPATGELTRGWHRVTWKANKGRDDRYFITTSVTSAVDAAAALRVTSGDSPELISDVHLESWSPN